MIHLLMILACLACYIAGGITTYKTQEWIHRHGTFDKPARNLMDVLDI